MNILFLDQFNSLGGAQQCLLDLLPAMEERGWAARVAIPGTGPLSGKLASTGIPVHPIGLSGYRSTRKTAIDFARFAIESPLLARQIASLVSSHRVDLLYVNGPRLLPAAAIAARCRSLPLIFHCHVRLGQQMAVRTAGWALRHSNATLIGCCEFAAQPLRKYVAPGKFHVIYNGTPDLGSAPARESISRIGIVGRIEADKGQMEFVQAARLLLAEFPHLRFSIVGAPLFSGPVYSERVRAASRDLPVDFQGWREDVAEAFSSIDLLAVPSAAHDPNPRVILEAFSARVPVVAFPSGGIPEIIRDGETGFLTAGRSAPALAVCIGGLLRMDRPSRARVVAQARLAWEQNYTAGRYRREIADRIAMHIGP